MGQNSGQKSSGMPTVYESQRFQSVVFKSCQPDFIIRGHPHGMASLQWFQGVAAVSAKNGKSGFYRFLRVSGGLRWDN